MCFASSKLRTGKSVVIRWLREFFEDALGWSHGEEFMCVAFQNRVAHAMGGVTIHSGGDVSVGGGDRNLSHTDVDVLFTRNQAVRWLLIDEVGMVSIGLLGALEKHLTDASQVNRYRHRADKTCRPFGGYNVIAFGDLYQRVVERVHLQKSSRRR